MIYNCIVVGLGNIGMTYDIEIVEKNIILSHCKAIESHPMFNLIGAVDPNYELQIKFKDKYRKPVYGKVEEFLKTNKADIYILACPTNLHYSILNLILEFDNPLLILCEKPLSYDLNEALQMKKKCDSMKVRLIVNYIRRSDIGAIEIKNKIESGEFQTPIKGICYYSKGLLHNGSHFINLLKYWLGEIITFEILKRQNDYDTVDSDIDMYISFEKGDIIFFSTTEKFNSFHSIELISKSGLMLYLNGGDQIEFHKSFSKNNVEIIANSMNNYQLQVYENIAILLNNEHAYELCESNEAIATMEDCIAILNT